MKRDFWRRYHGPAPEQGRQLKAQVAERLRDLSRASHWVCRDCAGINTREEDDHGQPAFCSSCSSVRLELRAPALIEPGDLL